MNIHKDCAGVRVYKESCEIEHVIISRSHAKNVYDFDLNFQALLWLRR